MQQNWQGLIDQTIQDEHISHAYAWEPFARGSSNSIFLGRLKPLSRSSNTKCPAGLNTKQNKLTQATVVLRINSPAKDTPGVNRSREALILNWIEPYDWAPQIIRNAPELGWCLMHQYKPLKTEGGKLSRIHQIQLLKALDELQATQVNTDTSMIDYTALLNDLYLAMATQRNDSVAKKWIQSVKENLSALPELPLCLVHHDIHLGNLVLSEQHMTGSNSDLVILDWEYAAIGNPWFDASCLSRHLSIPDQDIFTLRIFKSLNTATFESALKRANQMTEALEALWHWAREEHIT